MNASGNAKTAGQAKNHLATHQAVRKEQEQFLT
jgi:hypothetical protein